MQTKIQLSQKNLLTLLADLEFLIISLDRIGSADLSDDARRAALYDFVIEGDVVKRLAAMRKTISTALSQTNTREEILAIENRLEKVKAWIEGQSDSDDK